MSAGWGDEFVHGGGPDPCDVPKAGIPAEDMFTSDLHIDTLKVKVRNFH
jgi:error-prone DNA polymerase